jgi:ADP-ribosylation factor protein 1
MIFYKIILQIGGDTVFANKYDFSVMTVAIVIESLDLYSKRKRMVYKGTCALSGDGFYDGLDWLTKAVNSKK